MFDTHHTLHQALTQSGIWNGLYTALLASTPPLAVHSNCDTTGCGLEFFERRPRVQNAPVSGTVTILTSGTFAVRTDGFTGPRWHSALDRLATTAPTGWKWQPSADLKPGQLEGVLHPELNVAAETAITSSRHEDNATTALALTPESPQACTLAWTLAVTALGVVVTDDPTYSSPVIAAPTPATDYPAAISTVVSALQLLDEDGDFDTARYEDVRWPREEEGRAVRALRVFRDALIDVDTTLQSGPETIVDRRARAGIPAAPAADGAPLNNTSLKVGQILRSIAPEATSALVDLTHLARVCAVFAGENEIDTDEDTGRFDSETLGSADEVLRIAVDETSAGALAASGWEHVGDERADALYRITFPVFPAS